MESLAIGECAVVKFLRCASRICIIEWSLGRKVGIKLGERLCIIRKDTLTGLDPLDRLRERNLQDLGVLFRRRARILAIGRDGRARRNATPNDFGSNGHRLTRNVLDDDDIRAGIGIVARDQSPGHGIGLAAIFLDGAIENDLLTRCINLAGIKVDRHVKGTRILASACTLRWQDILLLDIGLKRRLVDHRGIELRIVLRKRIAHQAARIGIRGRAIDGLSTESRGCTREELGNVDTQVATGEWQQFALGRIKLRLEGSIVGALNDEGIDIESRLGQCERSACLNLHACRERIEVRCPECLLKVIGLKGTRVRNISGRLILALVETNPTTHVLNAVVVIGPAPIENKILCEDVGSRTRKKTCYSRIQDIDASRIRRKSDFIRIELRRRSRDPSRHVVTVAVLGPGELQDKLIGVVCIASLLRSGLSTC